MTADNVSQLHSGERIRVAATVDFFQIVCRQTITATRVKDHLPQFQYHVTVRLQVLDLPCVRRLCFIHEPEAAGVIDKQLRFTTGQPLPLVHAVSRAVQNAGNFCREVVVKETQNENAAGA